MNHSQKSGRVSNHSSVRRAEKPRAIFLLNEFTVAATGTFFVRSVKSSIPANPNTGRGIE